MLRAGPINNPCMKMRRKQNEGDCEPQIQSCQTAAPKRDPSAKAKRDHETYESNAADFPGPFAQLRNVLR